MADADQSWSILVVLTEAARIAGGNGEEGASNHERYLKLFKLLASRDHELADTFNDPRRSVAFFQLARMCRQRLVTDEEFATFTPELQKQVQVFMDLGK